MKFLKRYHTLFVVLFMLFCHALSAKENNTSPEDTKVITIKMAPQAEYILADTLRFHPMFDSIAALSRPLRYGERFFSPYYSPLIFFGKVSPSAFKVAKKEVNNVHFANSFDFVMEDLAYQLSLDSLREHAITKAMARNPYMIEYDWSTMPDPIKDEKMHTVIRDRIFEISKPDFAFTKLNVGLPDADRWKKRMQSSIQFSQNYVSDNWYQGGESNINILSIQSFQILRYDETKRTEFETKVDLKTGFYTTPSDTMRQFRVNDNLFQVTSKYGIRALKKWYYTGSMLFKTQVFNNYKPNSDVLQSQFLSPAELNFSVGMDYKHESKDKAFKWSILIAPLAYNLKYVANIEEIDEQNFGIDEGKHTLHQVGSSLTNQFVWKISKNIEWNSRLFLFSNYDNSQGDFENTFNFSINRYFSTRIMLHLRFDDDVKPEDDPFQFKELLSFGFNYVW